MRKIGKKKSCADCPGWTEFRIKMAIKNTMRNIEESIMSGDVFKEEVNRGRTLGRKTNRRKPSKRKRI